MSFTIEDAIKAALEDVRSTGTEIEYVVGPVSELRHGGVRVVLVNKVPRWIGDSLEYKFSADGKVISVFGGR